MLSRCDRTRLTGVLLIGLHVGAFAAVLFGHWGLALSLILASHALFLAGTLVPNSSLFGPVLRRLPTDERAVWLTIDDGVDPLTTPALLDCLRAHNVKATFFVIGRRAAQFPDLIQRMRDEGHEVANHTQNHPHGVFWAALPARVRKEIGNGSERFRSPVGMSNWFVHAHLRKLGQVPIGWTARGLDGLNTPREKVISKLRRSLVPGAIVLLHDGYDPGQRGYSPAEIVDEVLAVLRARGLRCILPGQKQELASV